MTQELTIEPKRTARSTEKYLTFSVANEEYGLEILRVREIVAMTNITVVPKMPQCVRGIINLSGRIIPVIDVRRRLDLPDGQQTRQNCIIVVTLETCEVGLLVDEVREVRNIAESQIQDTPTLNGNAETPYVSALAMLDERVILLVDIDELLQLKELHTLSENDN